MSVSERAAEQVAGGADRPEAEPAADGRTEALWELVESHFGRLATSSPGRLDGELVAMLGSVTRFLGADRGYVIRFDHAARTWTMTHEWCGPGIEPSSDWEQEVDFEASPRTFERLVRLEVSEIPDVAALPEDWAVERSYLQSEGIGGIIEVPFTLKGRLGGVVGFDTVGRSRSWFDQDVPMLRAVAALTERVFVRWSAEDALRRTVEELHDADAELGRSEGRFRALVDSLPDAVLRVAADYSVLYANPAASALRDRFEAMGMDMGGGWATLPPGARERVAEAVEEALEQHRRQEVRDLYLEGGGDEIWMQVTVIPELASPGEPTLLTVFRDVSEEHASRHVLEHRASHDDLTGLPNRGVFLARLRAACRLTEVHPDRRVGLLFVDLDNFKRVNDSHGHGGGDLVLRELARRLNEGLRSSALVARLGGDELTVLLDPADETSARRTAETARRLLAAPIDVGGTRYRFTASIGLVVSDGPSNPEDLMARADDAAYRAKAAGRDRVVVVDRTIRAAFDERRRLDRGLQVAAERDEIEVHYQPEVLLATGRPVGVEALARWNHPELGLLAAGRFIELAEENGAIRGIGLRVLMQACADVAGWRDAGLVDDGFVLRVNLSTRQVFDMTIVNQIEEALRSSGLPPGQLCLEVTETAIMTDTSESLLLLNEIRDMGVHLAIDDFGTGHSSLAMLRRLPIDVLKIDRSFVDGLPSDAEDRAIVRAMIGLGRALNLDVTAEGVEVPEQARALLEEGCERAQGYLYSPPAPAEEFPDLLAALGEGYGPLVEPLP